MVDNFRYALGWREPTGRKPCSSQLLYNSSMHRYSTVLSVAILAVSACGEGASDPAGTRTPPGTVAGSTPSSTSSGTGGVGGQGAATGTAGTPSQGGSAGGSPPTGDNLIWSGSFAAGNFDNYVGTSDQMTFWGCPPYGRPTAYDSNIPVNPGHIGSGELLFLTASAGVAAADPRFAAGPFLNGHAVGVRVKSTIDDWHPKAFASIQKISDAQFRVSGNARHTFPDPGSQGLGRVVRMSPGLVTAEVTSSTYDSSNDWTDVVVKNGVVPANLTSLEINWARREQQSLYQYNGPGDWDGAVTTRCRTELRFLSAAASLGTIWPPNVTRWGSFSLFLPNTWDVTPHSGWGPVTKQWKHYTGSGSPFLSFNIENGHWEIICSFSDDADPQPNGGTIRSHRFQPGLESSYGWDATRHYPNGSQYTWNVLANLNLGGWTHFVYSMHNDGRRSTAGGVGFFKLWMRFDDGPWQYVLHFYATADYPAFFPMATTNSNGFQLSNYMDNGQITNVPVEGRTLYFDNVKIGDENATFAEMSHDGTSP